VIEEKEEPEVTEDVISTEESDPEPQSIPTIGQIQPVEQTETTTRSGGRVSVPPNKFVPV
jgi:hypothetical protein